MINFKKEILVYLPCYNCEAQIIKTLTGIPKILHEKIECLVVDNQSSDKTSELVLKEIKNNTFPFKVYLIKPKNNLGYAGSQKLAYSIAVRSGVIRQVIMLHGDGQYSSDLIKSFEPYFTKEYALVNGYRDKKIYPGKEETPLKTYIIIKFLSILESLLTGIKQKEWHSGFVMYATSYLKKLPLDKLSPTPHIDGEFLICADILKEKTFSIPIYKKYKDLTAFEGLGRIMHVLNVFKIIFNYRLTLYHKLLKGNPASLLDVNYDILN